jgi:hypothetical protein
MATITSGRLVAVEAKRDKVDAPVQGMTMNINLDDVSSEKEEVTVQYTLTVQYHDNVGKLKISGMIVMHEDGKKLKEVMKEWKDKKRLPADVTEVLLNAINYTCAVNGTFFTQPLGLNAPMTLSPVRIGQLPAGAAPGKGEKAA